MTGLHDTDIRLDEEGQLTRATDGDAPLCTELECFYQSIILEAQTQRGELFYGACMISCNLRTATSSGLRSLSGYGPGCKRGRSSSLRAYKFR